MSTTAKHDDLSIRTTEDLSRFVDFVQAQLHQLQVLCQGEALQCLEGLLCQLRSLQYSSELSNSNKVFHANHDAHFVAVLLKQHPQLSPMEVQICKLLSCHMRTKDIAEIMCISQRSVENHRYRIRKKLLLEHRRSVANYVLGVVTS